MECWTEPGLRPLNLKAVADAIGVHESTVSRATSNKFMQTPRGLFEMKYFFTTSIASNGAGEAHSAESVRYKIKQMIDAEDPEDVCCADQSGKNSASQPTFSRWRSAPKLMNLIFRLSFVRIVLPVNGIFLRIPGL